MYGLTVVLGAGLGSAGNLGNQPKNKTDLDREYKAVTRKFIDEGGGRGEASARWICLQIDQFEFDLKKNILGRT